MSENCPSCGTPELYSYFDHCPNCDDTICTDCRDDHVCVICFDCDAVIGRFALQCPGCLELYCDECLTDHREKCLTEPEKRK